MLRIFCSCDIMQRWTYPVVPDLPFGCSPDEVVYNMNFNFVYKALSVKCARLVFEILLIYTD